MSAQITTCDGCARPSVTLLRYSGQRLCEDHFRRSVARRIRKEFRRQGGFARARRIVIATSGGKDSTVALTAMVELAQERRGVEISAVTLDEGIAGYRSAGLEAASVACQRLGIDHIVKVFREKVGATIDGIHAAQGPRAPCSYCGVFRRRLINETAHELGADIVVTGHNLDDVAQSVLMNLAHADLARLGRLGPHVEGKGGMVPRRMPLRTIPEKEVLLYAMLSGLEWDDGTCPYAQMGHRNVYRDVLMRLEDAKPGTRHALLRTHDALRPFLWRMAVEQPIGACVRCGRATSGTTCQACLLSSEAGLPLERAEREPSLTN